MLEYDDFLKFIPELPSKEEYDTIVSALPEPIDYSFNNENFEPEWDNLEEWFIRSGIISEYPSISLDSVNMDNKSISLCDAEDLDELNDLKEYLSKYNWSIDDFDGWIKDITESKTSYDLKNSILKELNNLSVEKLKEILDYVNKR